MASKIGTQHGIEATRQALHRLDPPPETDEGGYDRLLGKPGTDYGAGPVEGTLQKLVDGHNETIDTLAQLREELRQRPF